MHARYPGPPAGIEAAAAAVSVGASRPTVLSASGVHPVACDRLHAPPPALRAASANNRLLLPPAALSKASDDVLTNLLLTAAGRAVHTSAVSKPAPAPAPAPAPPARAPAPLVTASAFPKALHAAATHLSPQTLDAKWPSAFDKQFSTLVKTLPDAVAQAALQSEGGGPPLTHPDSVEGVVGLTTAAALAAALQDMLVDPAVVTLVREAVAMRMASVHSKEEEDDAAAADGRPLHLPALQNMSAALAGAPGSSGFPAGTASAGGGTASSAAFYPESYGPQYLPPTRYDRKQTRKARGFWAALLSPLLFIIAGILFLLGSILFVIAEPRFRLTSPTAPVPDGVDPNGDGSYTAGAILFTIGAAVAVLASLVSLCSAYAERAALRAAYRRSGAAPTTSAAATSTTTSSAATTSGPGGTATSSTTTSTTQQQQQGQQQDTNALPAAIRWVTHASWLQLFGSIIVLIGSALMIGGTFTTVSAGSILWLIGFFIWGVGAFISLGLALQALSVVALMPDILLRQRTWRATLYTLALLVSIIFFCLGSILWITIRPPGAWLIAALLFLVASTIFTLAQLLHFATTYTAFVQVANYTAAAPGGGMHTQTTSGLAPLAVGGVGAGMQPTTTSGMAGATAPKQMPPTAAAVPAAAPQQQFSGPTTSAPIVAVTEARPASATSAGSGNMPMVQEAV